MTDTTTAEAPPQAEPRERRSRPLSDRQRAAYARRRAGTRASASGEPAGLPEEIVGEAVANLTALAGYLMPFAPHTAVALTGVPHPQQEGAWLVRSRAQMAGNVLLEHARTNARVLAAIARFNALFQSVEVVELVTSVGAAIAVDAKLVDPHATVRLPGGLEASVMAPMIGDVIGFVDSQLAAQTPPVDTASTEELVVRMEAGDRAAAMELRRRREAADATIPRDGQTVVPGGVEGT